MLTPPYALIIDRDGETRARITALLRASGFVVAPFRETRGALAALAARPPDIAIVVAQEDEDAVAMARQVRHCQPDIRVLIAGAAKTLPANRGADSGGVVIRPFDKRRFLSAVFELLAHDGDAAVGENDAEFALITAQLACLQNRRLGIAGALIAQDVSHQIRDAMAARDALRPARGDPHQT